MSFIESKAVQITTLSPFNWVVKGFIQQIM